MYNTFKELATQEASNNHLEFFTNRNLGSRFWKKAVYLNGNLVSKLTEVVTLWGPNRKHHVGNT